jgi:hypothetical protein
MDTCWGDIQIEGRISKISTGCKADATSSVFKVDGFSMGWSGALGTFFLFLRTTDHDKRVELSPVKQFQVIVLAKLDEKCDNPSNPGFR